MSIKEVDQAKISNALPRRLAEIFTEKDFSICASLRNEAADMTERKQAIRDLLEKCTPMYGREAVQTSLMPDRTAELLEELEALERRTDSTVAKYLRHVSIMEDLINTLPDSRMRRVMRLYYLDGLCWEAVAEVMNYEERQCRRLRDEAFNFLEVERCPEMSGENGL